MCVIDVERKKVQIRETITLACKIVSETKRGPILISVVPEAIVGVFKYSMFNRHCWSNNTSRV